jgi:hypothetical protein
LSSGYDDGSIVDCSLESLESKINQLTENKTKTTLASQKHKDDLVSNPVFRRRTMAAHQNCNVVAMCVPQLPLRPGALVSCAQQNIIVVWSSPSDYISYAAHAKGARYGAVLFGNMPFCLGLSY